MAGPWEKYAKPTVAKADDAPATGPWTQYQAPQGEPEGRTLEAAVEGFGRGVPVVGSYLPQIQAGVSRLMPNPSSGVDARLRAQGFQISQPEESYVSERDAMIRRSQGLEAENPNAFLAGQVAGTVAGAALPAKALPKIPGVGKVFAAPSKAAGLKGVAVRAAQASGAAGMVGALENPGDVEGEISDSIEGRVSNAKTGAKFGALAQLGGEAIAKGAKAVATRAGQAAEGYAFKAAGANKGDIKRALTKGKASDIAGAALNETVEIADPSTGKVIRQRLLEPGDSVEDVAEKVGKLKASTGEKIGQVYDDVSNDLSQMSVKGMNPAHAKLIRDTNFRPEKFAQELRHQLANEVKGKAGGQAALARAETVLNDLAANGKTAGIKEMHAFRQSIDDLINYDKTLKDLPIATQKLKSIRDFVSDKIKARIDAVDQVLGGTKAAELKSANSLYGKMSELDRITKGGVAGEQSRAFLGLLDRETALGGAALGIAQGVAQGDPQSAVTNGLVYGLGGGLASRAARRYGPAAMARASQKAAGAFADAPGMVKEGLYMARRAPGVIGAGAGKAASQNSGLRPSAAEPESPAQPPMLGAPPEPPKGEEKWARDGAKNLGLDDAEMKRILATSEGRYLLIRASDADAKTLKRIKEQIQSGARAPAQGKGK